MAHVLVLYGSPSNAEAFNEYYTNTHIPIAKRIPGLRSYAISRGGVHALAGSAPHLVATLTFDSMADLQAALQSNEGQATAADLQNFATGGATLLVYESELA